MRRLVAFVVLAAALAPIAEASEIDGPSAQFGSHHPASGEICREGPPQVLTPELDKLRPNRTAICDYDVDEVRSRIETIFHGKNSSLSVEHIEKLFAIPRMTTSYDDAHTANYLMIVSGASGWKLNISVAEGFPDQGPAKFVPGLRPKRLDRFENSRAIVHLVLTTVAGTGRACPSEPFVADVRAAGWEDVTWRVTATDFGQAPPTFSAPDGRSVQIMPTGFTGPCQTQLWFVKPPPWEKADGGPLPRTSTASQGRPSAPHE